MRMMVGNFQAYEATMTQFIAQLNTEPGLFSVTSREVAHDWITIATMSLINSFIEGKKNHVALRLLRSLSVRHNL
jgi:hypothetical protein